MSARDSHTAFDTSHPAVPALYFAGTAVLMMFAMQPVYVGISLAGSLLCSFLCRGARATLRGLRWQLPMLALVCLANPLFVATGSTLLWRVGPIAVYAEALAYGACMGALMVSVVVWLECASRVLTQDRLLAVSGRVLPTVSLMVSMTAQLVPQLMRRASAVRQVTAACTAAGRVAAGGAAADGAAPGARTLSADRDAGLGTISQVVDGNTCQVVGGGRTTVPVVDGTTSEVVGDAPAAVGLTDRDATDAPRSQGEASQGDAPDGRVARSRTHRLARLRPHARVGTMLLTWALEDSLERADAMRARGWGATQSRTSYRTWRFRTSDAVAMAIIGLLLALDALLAWVACAQFSFYPTMPRLVAWWGYVPYAALVLIPSALDVYQRVMWR